MSEASQELSRVGQWVGQSILHEDVEIANSGPDWTSQSSAVGFGHPRSRHLDPLLTQTRQRCLFQERRPER